MNFAWMQMIFNHSMEDTKDILYYKLKEYYKTY